MAMPVDRDYDFDPAIKKIMDSLADIRSELQIIKQRTSEPCMTPKQQDKKKVK